MLDLVDEAFDQMPFSIQPPVIVAPLFGALVGRDDRHRSLFDNPIDQRLSGIAAIGDDVLSVQSLQQRLGLSAFVRLSRRQAQAQRIAQTVHRDMNFGAEAAATTPQCLALLVSAFFVRQLRRDERAQSWRPLAHVPYPGCWRNAQTFAPRRLHHTIVRNACKRYSNSHIRQAANAIALHCAVSKGQLRQSADTYVPTPPSPVDTGAGMIGFSSIRRLPVLSFS